MASEWVKMRSDLHNDPKVIVMARLLSERDGCDVTCDVSVTSHFVTDRHTLVTLVTVAALHKVWSAVNRVIDDEDFHPYLRIDDLDQISGVPGFGAAMQHVEWVQENEQGGLFFPNFREFNTPEKKRTTRPGDKKTGAERTREWRKRQANQQTSQPEPCDVCDESVTSHVTSQNVTVTPREEKRRVEKILNTPPPPNHHSAPFPEPEFTEGKAAADLIELGVQHPAGAIRVARTNGITYSAFRAILGEFRRHPGRWGPQALHYRVKNYSAGQPPSEGWPKDSPEWTRKQNQQRDRDREAAREAERLQQKSKSAELRQSLEQVHGPALDAMTDAQLATWLQETAMDEFTRQAVKRQLRSQGRASPSFRSTMLGLLEKHDKKLVRAG